MTCKELRSGMRKAIREAEEKLDDAIGIIQEASEALVDAKNDFDRDLPEAIDEGRAETAAEEWEAFQEVCDAIEQAAYEMNEAYEQLRDCL